MNQVEYKRNYTIDKMKGLLVVQMILAHTLQFFSQPTKVAVTISSYVNLTTFSGFLFCFGYVSYLAYFRKEWPVRRLLSGFGKTILAYFISGLGFWIILAGRPDKIKGLLVLEELPGYTEFLFSFALLYLCILIFFPLFEWLVQTKQRVLVGCILSLLFTLIPYGNSQNIFTASLIGSTFCYAFPLIPYFSYFLAGVYLASHQTKKDLGYFLIPAVGGAVLFTYNYIKTGSLPERFPPSFLWIMGAYLVVYGYFIFLGRIQCRWTDWILCILGKHTLLFLVASNWVLFGLAARWSGVVKQSNDNGLIIVLIYLLAVCVPGVVALLLEKRKAACI